MSSHVTAEARRAALVAVACGLLLMLAGVAGSAPLTLILIVAILALSCLSPAGVLLAALASLPYFYRPLDIVAGEFAPSELLLIASAGGTAVRSVVGLPQPFSDRLRAIPERLLTVLRSPFVIAAGLLALLGAVLVLFPFDPAHRAASLREWRWTLAEPLLLLILLTWHGRSRWLPELAALAVIAGVAVASLHAIADLALGGGMAVGGVTRIAGPYPHPNALALMTVRIVALAFVWAVYDARVRRWIGPLLLVSAIAVAATFSRGAMLAALVALAVVLVQAPVRVRLIGVASVVAAGLVAVVAARDRMLDLFGGGSGSLRIDIWTSALEMIGDRPAQGYGPDQFLYAYLPRYVQPTAWGERFTSHAHNLLLDAWIRLGIIGAAFATLAALLCLLTMARRMRAIDYPHPLRMAASVALVATIAHGMVDNAFFAHDLAMSCWLLAWLAFGSTPDPAGSEGEVDIARARFGRSRLHRFPSVR